MGRHDLDLAEDLACRLRKVIGRVRVRVGLGNS